jgi:serine/threonine protein kinase
VVALKVPNQDIADSPDVLRRLRNEAAVLQQIHHRAIVKVDRLALLDGSWTIIMEYVPGVAVTSLIRRGRIPAAVAIEVLAEVSGALDAAWVSPNQAGQPLRLIHRDIRPSNILITSPGEVKVLDFGIARAQFEGLDYSTLSVNFGSLGYMSPERLTGVNSEAVDVYSLGVVLFEMLSRKRLGKTTTRREVHDQRLAAAVALVRDRAEDASAELVALLSRMLAFEPDERPSVAEVHADSLRMLGKTPSPLREWARTRVPAILREQEYQARQSLEPGMLDKILVETRT